MLKLPWVMKMRFFDAHSDIWYNVGMRMEKGETNVLENCHLPQLKEGKVIGVNAALWTKPDSKNPSERFIKLLGARSKELTKIGKESEDFVIVTKSEDIQKAVERGKIFLISSVEGLIGIGKNLNFLYTLYELGFRVVSLTWNEENDLAAGCGTKDENKGLTNLGKQAVKIIEELGMVLDVSHLNEKSFWDVAKISEKPFIATHSNCYSLCETPRNLKDEQIKEIAKRGGIIGISALPRIVDRENPTVEKFVEHIKYAANFVGVDHVGLGLDFSDYLEEFLNKQSHEKMSTKDLEDATKLPQIIPLLEKAGFTKKEIDRICFLNFVEFFKAVL
ncbi:Membrane dipeptidase [Pseudothermotoga thermarum DSM 5069]|uniref:Membrane dipeptidase n=2 Tax=Pseudothermotoga thermarum TaxID=119394 RepID=F7YV36_9THEM|nr:Membrane dipeptidase [Pseudothermotoga thermarum DSM 5069]